MWLIKSWWQRQREKWCNHNWVEYEENSAKRKCLKCNRIEWLFRLPFPSSTEPSLQWKEMF